MITRRSLFGLTFGGAVATALPASPEKRSDAIAPEAGTVSASASSAPMRITFGRHGRACKVEVEGVDISRHCRAAVVRAEVGDITTLSLDMYVPEGAEVVAEQGALELILRDPSRRYRFENVERVKADV